MTIQLIKQVTMGIFKSQILLTFLVQQPESI